MVELPKLYHGTDARLVRMSKAERQDYMNSCQLVIDYLWKIFKPMYDGKIKESQAEPTGKVIGWPYNTILYSFKDDLEASEIGFYWKFFDILTTCNANKLGNKLYEYGDFYLTTLFGRAERFARGAFAGGEKGRIAFYMIEAVNILGLDAWDGDSEIWPHIERVYTFAEGKKEPVVIEVQGLDESCICLENGAPVIWAEDSIQNLRYTKDVKLNLDNATFLE